MQRLLRLLIFFFFNDTATTEIYTLSLHDALPISPIETQQTQTFSEPMYGETRLDACYEWGKRCGEEAATEWCKLRSEEHTSELQSLAYLVCRLLLEKKK